VASSQQAGGAVSAQLVAAVLHTACTHSFVQLLLLLLQVTNVLLSADCCWLLLLQVATTMCATYALDDNS
jgi:hypothetical protein